jgi:HK97 family phage portal protein
MSIFNLFRTKAAPTTKNDFVAYQQGAKSEYQSTYNDYAASVEAIDKVIRTISNIASMAKLETWQESTKGVLKPLKVSNVDFMYNTNEYDSQGDFIGMIFGGIMTQGASFVLSSPNKQTKFINFYCYDASRWKIYAKENNLFDSFVYTSEGGQQVPYDPKDVIYIAPRNSAANLVYSVSKLKALNDLLSLQANVMKQTTDYYNSGGKSSTIISPKEPMGAEKARELKTAFDTFLQTTATKTLFLNTEVDVNQVSNAQSPYQIMQALTIINNMIIEQFGVPQYFFGKYDGYVNDAAIITAARVFFQIHMMPIFKSIEYQFTKYFRTTLKLQKAIVKFNFEEIEILKDNIDSKIAQAEKLYKLGLMSMNEARALCELEPLTDDAANRHFVPAYLTGQYPVSIEEFDQTLDKLFLTDGVSQDQTSSSGSSGGVDNTNLITGSNGGAGNKGE